MARLYLRGRIWWTWFYDEAGARHDESTRCRDKRAAESVARRLERSAAAPAHAASTTTLAEACERFRVDKRNRGRAADTLTYYETKLGHLLRVFGDELLLERIDAAAVDDYVAARLEEEASQHTVAKELGTLRGVLRGARRRGEYSGDPAAVLPEGWTSGYVPRNRSVTLPQAKELVLSLPLKRGAMVAHMLAGGSRLGEAERAQRGDIDLSAGTIYVRGTKTQRSARTVPIFEHAQWFAGRALEGAANTGPAYERWTNVRRDLAVACRRLKLPKVTPNDLRRSASTWLVERGAPSNLVALFLGHTTSRMVEQVYGRVEGRQLADAFAAVGIRAAAELQRQPAVSGAKRGSRGKGAG